MVVGGQLDLDCSGCTAFGTALVTSWFQDGEIEEEVTPEDEVPEDEVPTVCSLP